jgi:hypothetical protein
MDANSEASRGALLSVAAMSRETEKYSKTGPYGWFLKLGERRLMLPDFGWFVGKLAWEDR